MFTLRAPVERRRTQVRSGARGDATEGGWGDIFLLLAMARELVRKAAEEPANIDRMQELDKLLRQIDQDTHSALGGAPKSLDDLFNQLS
ncbi:MAG: hypothetical protein IPH95_11775 [Candidatus Promineofilum sp.]|nr:hypothetical protein [Promineifilum sp.]